MNAHQRKKNAKAFIAELKAHCDDEKVSSLLEAADDLRKRDKENEQLRQRVAELEKERDKATQYWQIAEGRCDALKQQRDELVSALEWHPIETAPNDGSVFLGYKNGLVRECYKVQRSDCDMWCFGGTSGDHFLFPTIRPTHWMPLPAAPSSPA